MSHVTRMFKSSHTHIPTGNLNSGLTSAPSISIHQRHELQKRLDLHLTWTPCACDVRVLQRVALCCSVVQCVAVCCSETWSATHLDPLCLWRTCVAARCTLLQRVAVCCSVLQWDLICNSHGPPVPVTYVCCSALHSVAVCCSVLQWDLICSSPGPPVPVTYVCCNALHRVALCCSMCQCVAVRLDLQRT